MEPGIIHHLLEMLSESAGNYMMALMVGTFCVAFVVRLCIYYIIKSEQKFTKEFEARVVRHMMNEYKTGKNWTFQKITDFLLKKTFHETYLLQKVQGLRRIKYLFTQLLNKIFGIERGANLIIEDTLQQTKFLRGGMEQNFDMGLNFVFSSNPYFNRLFRIFSIGMIDDILSILPGIFIIGGLFGTFLGIMGGLPALQVMDVTDMQKSSETLNFFLRNMGFAMGTSVLGILLSVGTTVLNTIFSLKSIYVDLIERYKNSLIFLFKETTTKVKKARLITRSEPKPEESKTIPA